MLRSQGKHIGCPYILSHEQIAGGQEKVGPKLEAVHAATVRQEFVSSVPDGEALGVPQPPITDAAGALELDDADNRR